MQKTNFTNDSFVHKTCYLLPWIYLGKCAIIASIHKVEFISHGPRKKQRMTSHRDIEEYNKMTIYKGI